ncbi:murein hydrolase activator EnvC [Conservatibacter flavescens]|uniref:Murein hydrolase activator EnvC n=1 Tax=Conservatibacter flavescens TaxID=28161 RepID=A0A2M8S1A5_9PAST|nr:murein hydrolase activator EnvC [Conservatibacter flavescens]PJG84915.1 murein hydrolase activator EnvC [Conservatibacter flavescens]
MLLSFYQKKFQILTALSGVLLCVLPSAHANDLSKIQQQIKQTEQQIAQQKREQSKLQSTLKTQENRINNVINDLRKTEAEIRESNKIIAETDKQITQLEKQEKAQKEKLAKQLDSAYRANNNPALLEQLLSEEAKNAERMKVYYAHMNKARLALIDDLKKTQEQLAQNKAFIQEQQKAQQAQLNEQKKQQRELQSAKNEREKTLNQINRTLQKDENRLATLRANENALRQEIQRAERAAREQEKREREAYAQKKANEEKKNNRPYQPTAQEQQLLRTAGGLGQPRKQYRYPVSGKILNSYGSTQAGEVRWKGIVIGASAGTPVSAIADGRVILASWLQGYGLVVAIEHGKGDISLYGYNQSVAVRVGNLVRAGQKIAEVGNSGGQGRSSLFFQITRQGNPVNPVGWLK